MYNQIVIDHFMHPHNVGEMPDADGVGEAGNPICGDMMKLYIKIKDDVIVDIKFQTFGCGAAIASSSMLTDIAKGITIEEAEKLTRQQIVDALGELPANKIHCSILAVDALRAAIADWRKKKGNEK